MQRELIGFNMKVSVIGAGNIGATCAHEIANKELVNDLVLLDIREGLTKGKALDIWQTSPINHFDTRIIAAHNDFEQTKDSDIIVLSAGVHTREGMTEDEFIRSNARIIQLVLQEVHKYAPNAIPIIVSNYGDVMTHAACLTGLYAPTKIIGIAGILDTARYKTFIAEALDISAKSVHAILMGGHAEQLVALPRYTTISGIPVTEWINQNELLEIVSKTQQISVELSTMMGDPAYYAPGAAAAQMVEAILKNSKRILPAFVRMNGHYGLRDMHFGAPAITNISGIQEVVDLNLQKDELDIIHQAAEKIKLNMNHLEHLLSENN